jgi:RNA polymerase sigma-70 factor, ECF subfamily
MDDATLVAGLQHRDAPAIEYVVQHYAPVLHRFAYYQLQDAALAQDLVSEVMVRMLGRLDTFCLEQGSFRSWLFAIARHLIADHYRARKRRPEISLERWLAAEPAREPGQPDGHIDLLLDREQLKAGLATLTEEQRHVIVLHVVVGWQLPEVAELLGRSVPSVKSLYYRGMHSLRRALLRDRDPPAHSCTSASGGAEGAK